MTRVLSCLVCTLAFFIAGVRGVSGQTPLELVERLRTSLQSRYDEKKVETAGHPTRDHDEKFALQVALNSLQTIDQALAAGNEDSALLALDQLRSDNQLSGENNAALEAIVQQMRAERTSKVAAYTGAVDAACQRAAASVLQAKEPKDLDATLRELAQLSEQPVIRPYNERTGGNGASKLKAATNFVNHWQDYLQAHNRNNENNARAELHNLINNSNDQPLLIPRSEILAREPATESEAEAATRRRSSRPELSTAQIDAAVLEIIRGLKTTSDVPAALAKLADLRREASSQSSYSYNSESSVNVALTNLESFQKVVLELQSGLATGISLGFGRSESFAHPEIEMALWPLRVQLIEEAAPRLMGLTDAEKPAGSEPVGVYLHRLIESAKARQNWAAVVRGLTALRMLSATNSNPDGIGNEQQVMVFRSLLSASNLEQAGQYEEAVAFYLTALRSGQDGLPNAWVGEHLTALKKAHPAEYARGTTRSPEDVRAAYSDLLRAYRSVYNTRSQDVLDFTPPSPANSPVPSVTPTPAPAPTPLPLATPVTDPKASP